MVDNEIIMTRRYIMKDKPEFHGSDLEKIAEYYHIDQNSIIKFGANVNPLGLSDTVKKDLATHLDVISSYPDRDYKSLKATIGGYVHADPEHIVVGNGSTELISLLINQRAPKKALVLGPTYSEYARELSMIGGVIEYFHLKEEDNFVLNIPALLQTLKQDAAIDLLIICNPNNPTSQSIPREDIEKLAAVCREYEIFLIIDEMYIEFTEKYESRTAVPLVKEYDNLAVLRSVSKFFSVPGLRLAYAVMNNETNMAIINMTATPNSISCLTAAACTAMLEDKGYIRESRSVIFTERNLICSAMGTNKNLRLFKPSANYVLIQILKQDVSAETLLEHCRTKGIILRSCADFRGLDERFVRFSIMNPKQNDLMVNTILEALS